MRLQTSSWLLSLAVLSPISNLIQVRAADADAGSVPTTTSKEPAVSDEKDDAPTYTRFNGIEVPPMKELTAENFDTEIKDGYWFVKYHSPWCRHCIAVAPVWQTLYEFYYTSSPVSSSQASKDSQSSLNSFHPYYNFHFASLDCVAFGSVCEAHKAHAFPTFLLYKDGEMVKTFDGNRDLQGFSNFVEEILESIRPGSRPKEGVKLPKVGADGVDVKAKPDAPVAKDKDAAAGAAAGQKQNDKAAQEAGKSSDKTAPDAEKSSEKAASDAEKSSDKAAQDAGQAPEKAAQVAEKAPDKAVAADAPRATKAGKSGSFSKQTFAPNPAGTSVALSADAFQSLVTTTQDAWFVKFYAPWCPHCQAIAPTWAQLAREMKGQLNIGEVNCEVERRLCKDVRIQGYPTIIFFKGGERVEYDGLRGVGDLIDFAKKALDIGDEVKRVDATAFKEMEETEEVLFVYFYNFATTSEDLAAIEQVRLSLIGHAKLVKSDDPILADRFKISTWPRLLVSRDGRPTYYSALTPRDMRDYRKILAWMKSVWLPIVPELSRTNAVEILDGKYVVLGVLSRERSDEFVSAKREIKSAALEWMDKETQNFQRERQELRDAKQLRIAEAEDRGDQRALRAAKTMRVDVEELKKKPVGFAWIDGIFWERWLRTTYGVDVKEGERVIITDEDNRHYWDVTASGNFIVPSRSSILETLPKVVSSPPKLKPKSTMTTIGRLFFELRRALSNHPYLMLGGLLGLLVTLASWGRRRMRRGRGLGASMNSSSHGAGFFRLDGKDGLLASAGLGGGQNGKVD